MERTGTPGAGREEMIMMQVESRYRPAPARSGSAQTTALLVGGPPTLSAAERRVEVEPGTDRVRLPHRGGHEHFHLDGEPRSDGSTRVFRWVSRTELAE